MDELRDYYTKWNQKQRQIPLDITYIWNLIFKSVINEFICKTETYLQISKANWWLPKKKHEGGGLLGASDWNMHTTVYNIGNQQEPPV